MYPPKQEKRDIRYAKAAIKQKIKFGGITVVSEALVKPGATNLVPKVHVKKGDLVKVISGSVEMGKGKTGKVLQVLPKEGKVVVEGINLKTKASKPRGPMAPGGLTKKEAPIFACKVMLFSTKSNKAVRAEFRKKEDID